MTMNEIRKAGIDALVKELGPVNAIRFLQQYETGKGDYTKERDKITTGMTMESFWKNMEMEN
jgi:hypothetical protein